MEKLIELLNEYDGDALEYGFVDGDIRRKVKNFDNERNTWKSVVWYTKKFGFIKWLLDNNKINKGLISRVLIRAYVSPKTLVSLECEFHDYYESLLMLLSIQDEPINFLISILK